MNELIDNAHTDLDDLIRDQPSALLFEELFLDIAATGVAVVSLDVIVTGPPFERRRGSIRRVYSPRP